MPDWGVFLAVVGVVLTLLLALAHLTARAGVAPSDGDDLPPPAPGALLLNVSVSQGGFAVVLLAAAWYARVPPATLGAGPDALAPRVLGAGVAAGVGLYLANETGAALGDRVGLGRAENLRAALAPRTRRGWVVLLCGVLPVVAGFEELLFRGILVGAVHAGFGVSPWLLAVLSSLAFAAGHGTQGATGVIVTGALGFALAATFVLTGSLAAVVLAHYLVNALEFLVHERPGRGA